PLRERRQRPSNYGEHLGGVVHHSTFTMLPISAAPGSVMTTWGCLQQPRRSSSRVSFGCWPASHARKNAANRATTLSRRQSVHVQHGMAVRASFVFMMWRHGQASLITDHCVSDANQCNAE